MEVFVAILFSFFFRFLWAIIGGYIAKRKGRNALLWGCVCLIFGLIGILVLFLLSKTSPAEPVRSKKLPPRTEVPLVKVPNNKLILIGNCTWEEAKQLLTFDTLSYELFLQVARWEFKGHQFTVLTFPYDIEFNNFCNLLRMLDYVRMTRKSKAEIRGWSTLPSTLSIGANEQAMVYDDFYNENMQDFELIIIVTAQNQEYEYDYEKQEMEYIKESRYMPCPIAYKEAVALNGELMVRFAD